MRQLKPYNAIIMDFKISKNFHAKNPKYLKNAMMLKKTKFIKFFIVNLQKGKHIRKAQSISNLIKKKIVKNAYETVVI